MIRSIIFFGVTLMMSFHCLGASITGQSESPATTVNSKTVIESPEGYKLVENSPLEENGRIVEIPSFSAYGVFLPNDYTFAQTIADVYFCFSDNNTGASFVTRSAEAGNMNLLELANLEFKIYPGELDERWKDGKSFVLKVGDDEDGMSYACFATKVDNIVYFGNFGIPSSEIESEEGYYDFFNNLFFTLSNFPLINSTFADKN